MEKRITGILAAFMLAVLAGSGMVQAAAIGTPYVAEQAIGKAPNMKAYVTGSKMKKNAAVTGKIGDIELTQNGDITTFQKSGEKMNYIILMDNSGSVNETQFAEAKEQLKNLRKSLKKGDEMTLYTVGTDNAGGEKTQVFARKVQGKDKEKKEKRLQKNRKNSVSEIGEYQNRFVPFDQSDPQRTGITGKKNRSSADHRRRGRFSGKRY